MLLFERHAGGTACSDATTGPTLWPGSAEIEPAAILVTVFAVPGANSPGFTLAPDRQKTEQENETFSLRHYHLGMRRWFFLLLIVLLPLRGWIGDAMAMQMALPDPHAHVSAPALAGAGDCNGHAGAQDAGDPIDGAHCDTCTLCQSCHTVAVLPAPEWLAATQAGPVAPAATMHVFASADRALFLKPPIF